MLAWYMLLGSGVAWGRSYTVKYIIKDRTGGEQENPRAYNNNKLCVYIFLSGVYYVSKMAVRSLGRLASNTCYFFLCDMQEKFRPSIRYFPEIVTVAQRLVSLKLTLIHNLEIAVCMQV